MVNLPSGSRVIVPNTIALLPAWLSGQQAQDFYDRVVNETYDFSQGQLSYFHGRRFDPGHRMCRYGMPGVTYTFKGKPKPLKPLTPALEEIRQLLVSQLNVALNTVVVNYYFDGTSGLYPHTDDAYIPQLGPQPTIIGVSFGGTRTFSLTKDAQLDKKSRMSKSCARHDLPLGHGDLLVMWGDSQKDWRHGIPIEPNATEPRVSLTYRYHY